MATDPSPLDQYVAANSERFLDELFAFLRIPSISTLPENKPDIDRAVAFLMHQARAAGLENVEALDMGGNPIVYADWLHAPGAPTILCYSHYDVQPPDPLAEWHSPPFEPSIRDGNIYARGAADDKGQSYTHIKAVETLLRVHGRLPVNVRLIIEGEEEVGGEAVDRLVRQHAPRLACDCALVSDTAMFAAGLPSLDVGLRGMVYAEIELQGAERDLHSGIYGGVAPNPLEALARILTGLKSPDGVILVPGLYDDVRAPCAEELADWRRLPFDEAAYCRDEVRAESLTGERGFSVFERTWARPSLDVHGIPGGFTGPGSKTVIPARASAKVSLRLVPDQQPAVAARQMENAVRALLPAGYRCHVRVLNLADPVLVPTDNRFIQAAVASLRQVFHADPVFIRSGGSIPIVALFAAHLHAPTVMMGFGLPDDGLHSPNEKFAVRNYFDGIRSVVAFFQRASG